MKSYTHKDWISKAKELFGENCRDWKFKCCNCGHEQSIADFEAAGIEEPAKKVHFSCIGRWIGGEGTISNEKVPCNYTIGGLFNLATVSVQTEDGDIHYSFDFGTPTLI